MSLKERKNLSCRGNNVYTKTQRKETAWYVIRRVNIPRLINSGGINSYQAPDTHSSRWSNLNSAI